MTTTSTQELVTGILLSGLVGLLAVSLLATALILLYVRHRRSAALRLRRAQPILASGRTQHDSSSIFQPVCRWLVVRSQRLAVVQTALGLHNPVACSWGEGVAGLTRRKLFVAPPVHGWILVIGPGLPDPSEDVDLCFHFIRKLSQALGHVQFFSSNRVSNHHAWVRADRGHIQRAYAWSGQTLWNQGPITQAELELGLRCYGYGEGPHPVDGAGPNGARMNSDKVLALAARWSFDPLAVEVSSVGLGLGVAGEVADSRLH